jgi:hypothetical protein
MTKSRSFLLLAVLTVLLLPGALLAAPGNGNGNGNGNNPGTQSAFDHEPVLIYEVSGGTIAGPTRLLLTLYTNEATLVQQQGTAPETLCTATLTADQIRELQRDLRQAGALRLRDQRTNPVPDVPLTTVTFFVPLGNSGKSQANTFSYYVPSGRASDVEDVIRAFIAETFTTCS